VIVRKLRHAEDVDGADIASRRTATVSHEGVGRAGLDSGHRGTETRDAAAYQRGAWGANPGGRGPEGLNR